MNLKPRKNTGASEPEGGWILGEKASRMRYEGRGVMVKIERHVINVASLRRV